MAEEGHEDQFRPPSLNGRCRFGEATFAGIDGKEEDAPSAVIPALAPERGSSTLKSHSWPTLRMVAPTR